MCACSYVFPPPAVVFKRNSLSLSRFLFVRLCLSVCVSVSVSLRLSQRAPSRVRTAFYALSAAAAAAEAARAERESADEKCRDDDFFSKAELL